MKQLRQPNREIISYTPRVEPAPPTHAQRLDDYRDVWLLRGKFVAFVLAGDTFCRSPAFEMPQAAQRWADQMRQDDEV
ncbi:MULTISPECIES: cell division activator CedA [Tenebrionibacter/Tenebrionicola group]|jgi:cell division activator|uniref:Cell division activator CedA n=2 Tax=Tenebrionibacter/Tenebrionicola group TaxID=2969848 RepID=A0A8K0V4W3_9ENTR|nr:MULTISPECIES: cell division activator CedA [Tenebrionibacter/Tenebrionicola group]MBK4714237.1 cell division activator CedA [Tenebrionibacter intestinalis]MBV4413389.1 cell division activator CedA [Tenebrionicola larvae]MBV5094274.1 cell division activator CedA [Tenebrionicola larvae]